MNWPRNSPIGKSHIVDSIKHELVAIAPTIKRFHISYCFSLEPRIIQSVRELGDLLLNVKGGGNVNNTTQAIQRNAVAVEADEVLRPLMDLLDGSLSLYAQSCEKTVLKRLLKELWKIVMRILEKTIVLPPMTDRTVNLATFNDFELASNAKLNFRMFTFQMMFKNLTDNAKNLAANAKIEDMSRLFKNHMAGKQDVKNALSGVMDISKEVEKNLSPKQCAVLDVALDTIKQYFHAGGNGLKKTFLEKSPELQSLRYALSLYTQTTDTLIKTFITSQVHEGKSRFPFNIFVEFVLPRIPSICLSLIPFAVCVCVYIL